MSTCNSHKFNVPREGLYRFTFSATTSSIKRPGLPDSDSDDGTVYGDTAIRIGYNTGRPGRSSEAFDIIDGSHFFGANLAWTWIKRLSKGDTVQLYVARGWLQV